MEEHLYFKNSSGKELFGVIHYPEKQGSMGVLFCHPLFEEKLHVHRVLVDFSRLLASSGFAAMRFDYYGDGDSEGEFEESTVESRLIDISSALKFFEHKTCIQRVALLGIRFGATLAAILAEKEGGVDALMLWAPVLKGYNYIQQLLRINLAEQVVVHRKVLYTRQELVKGLNEGRKINVEGYEISKELYEQISIVDLLARDRYFGRKTALVQFCKNPTENDPDMEMLKVLYSRNGEAELIKSSDPPFWEDMKYYPAFTTDLFDKTVDWLKNNL